MKVDQEVVPAGIFAAAQKRLTRTTLIGGLRTTATMKIETVCGSEVRIGDEVLAAPGASIRSVLSLLPVLRLLAATARSEPGKGLNNSVFLVIPMKAGRVRSAQIALKGRPAGRA